MLSVCLYEPRVGWHTKDLMCMQPDSERGKREFSLVPHRMPFSILESEVKDVYRAVSNSTNSSGLTKNVTNWQMGMKAGESNGDIERKLGQFLL